MDTRACLAPFLSGLIQRSIRIGTLLLSRTQAYALVRYLLPTVTCTFYYQPDYFHFNPPGANSVFTAVLSGTDGTLDVWSNGGTLGGAWVSSAGTTCSNPTAIVTVTCTGGTGSDCCSSIPTISVKCNKRIESSSDSVIVKLASSTSPKFQRATDWGDNSMPIMHQESTSIGTPGWINNMVGEIIPVTADTVVSYQGWLQLDASLHLSLSGLKPLFCFCNRGNPYPTWRYRSRSHLLRELS